MSATATESKTDKLVAEAQALGLDIEPERFDEQAVGKMVKGLKRAEMTPEAVGALEAEQLNRAGEAPRGLTGHALATFIVTGERLSEQQGKAKTTREAAAGKAEKHDGPREGSAMWAALEVLKGRRKPMHASEIYAEIKKRKLAPGLKGKTPDATLAAQLAVNAKAGRYVQKPEPGKYLLLDATPSGR